MGEQTSTRRDDDDLGVDETALLHVADALHDTFERPPGDDVVRAHLAPITGPDGRILRHEAPDRALVAAARPDELATRRSHKRTAVLAGVAASAVLVFGGGGVAAASGSLPEPVQNFVADAVEPLGIDVPRGQSADAPGRGGTAPGNSENAPGQEGGGPGNSENAPGLTGEAPGQGGENPSVTAPGQSGESPSGTAPGQSGESPSGTAPGQSGESPSGTPPGQPGGNPSETAPGQGGRP